MEEDMGALYLGAISKSPLTEEEVNITWEVEMPTKRGKILFKVDTGADVQQ